MSLNFQVPGSKSGPDSRRWRQLTWIVDIGEAFTSKVDYLPRYPDLFDLAYGCPGWPGPPRPRTGHAAAMPYSEDA